MTYIRLIDIGGYKQNYEDLFENFTYQMLIKYGENNHNSRCPCKVCGNSIIPSLSLLMKSYEEEIKPFGDHVDTASG